MRNPWCPWCVLLTSVHSMRVSPCIVCYHEISMGTGAIELTGRFATQHFDPSPLHLYAGWPLAEQSRQDAMERYYGDNVSELRRVKVRVDPENVFRCPQSIDGT